jgi:hypothetical protein
MTRRLASISAFCVLDVQKYAFARQNTELPGEAASSSAIPRGSSSQQEFFDLCF